MPRYRSTLTERELNYSDSGGPIVGPGEIFEHDIPADQLASNLQSGVIVPVIAELAISDELFRDADRAAKELFRQTFGTSGADKKRPVEVTTPD